MKVLTPKIEGRFNSYNDWVNHASRTLTGYTGSVGEKLPVMCVDSIGRRMHVGKDFMRARDEGTFPVYFFLECEEVEVPTELPFFLPHERLVYTPPKAPPEFLMPEDLDEIELLCNFVSWNEGWVTVVMKDGSTANVPPSRLKRLDGSR